LNTMNKNHNKVCLVCNRDEQNVPLLQVDFKGTNYYICPQHLPVLIHDPGQLEGKLPGANGLQAG
jgi:hypothetical protein